MKGTTYRYDQPRRRPRLHEPGPAAAEIIRRLADGGLTWMNIDPGTGADANGREG